MRGDDDHSPRTTEPLAGLPKFFGVGVVLDGKRRRAMRDEHRRRTLAHGCVTAPDFASTRKRPSLRFAQRSTTSNAYACPSSTRLITATHSSFICRDFRSAIIASG